MAGPIPLLPEFEIIHRWESCVLCYNVLCCDNNHISKFGLQFFLLFSWFEILETDHMQGGTQRRNFAGWFPYAAGIFLLFADTSTPMPALFEDTHPGSNCNKRAVKKTVLQKVDFQ